MKQSIFFFMSAFLFSLIANAQWTELSGSGAGKAIYNDNGRIWVIGTNDGIYSFNGIIWTEYPGGGRGKDIAVFNGVHIAHAVIANRPRLVAPVKIDTYPHRCVTA